MALTQAQEKRMLAILLAVLVLLVLYRIMTAEEPKTAPLTYERGAVATSPVRRGHVSSTDAVDPLLVFLERKKERFPGVKRNIFLMKDPRPKPKPKPKPATPPPPLVPQKSPEEIAADFARADLSKFRFIGYLTEEDSSLFLSKEGKLYIVQSGDKILKNYRVKEAGKDYVILFDTVTNVEVRVELTGGEDAARPTPSYQRLPTPYQRPPTPYRSRVP